VTLPVLALGIRPRGTEDLAQLTDQLHHVGRCDHGVKIKPAAFDLLDHVFGSDEIGSGLFGLFQLLACSDDEDPLGYAGPVGKGNRSAHLLIGLAGIHSKPDVELDAFVELCSPVRLAELKGFTEAVKLLAVDIGLGCLVTLAFLAHPDYLPVVIVGREWPCHDFFAGLVGDFDTHRPRGAHDHLHRGIDVIRVQIFHLELGDFPDLALRHLGNLRLVRHG
jgi:hypothetical protein